MKKINWKVLIFCLLIVYLIAFLGSLFTSPVTDSEWYETIRPSITPPNFVFPIVWNILFFLIAISLYLSWTSADKIERKIVFLVFGVNLLLNLFWSFLYFGMQNPLLAFFELIFLWFSILIMIFATYRINKTASYLLWPYFVWVSFAGILNYLSAF
ncbi:tryptophan-rich sensory protein [Candidatus Pacearchaeota archaeon]|nr:tryptophan-rich sensory protein [Candidatus Pacearchaeota archaeon]